ncbi:cell wall-binding repeat-containing protein [Agromyces sp. NPDC127015]|uniref:cell wall-binding repeat-containing protein n=1 Tax=Agromyces sp. NPDC127015 TaxID=3347108 RepID=UPI00364FCBFD
MTRFRSALLATAAAASLLFVGIAPANAATYAPEIERIAGADRYQTAVEISQEFAPGVSHVFIATGADFPDALGAAAVAGAMQSPILLVTRNSVPSSVIAEIKRLKPGKIVIVGGTGVVGSSVATTLSKLGSVQRIAGSDRYDTNRRLVRAFFEADGYSADVAAIATGRDYPDALAASAAAGDMTMPIVLVDGKARSVGTATKQLFADSGVTYGVFIVGGTGAVSSSIEKELATAYPRLHPRLAGVDRYATGAAVNEEFFGNIDYSTAYLAVGTGFADALAGGPLAANLDDGSAGPLYLVQRDCVPAKVKQALLEAQPQRIVLLGGKGVLTDRVAKLQACS